MIVFINFCLVIDFFNELNIKYQKFRSFVRFWIAYNFTVFAADFAQEHGDISLVVNGFHSAIPLAHVLKKLRRSLSTK